MILNNETFMEQLKNIIGEDSSDEAIQFLENASDTLSDYQTKIGEDWKKKYEENDAEWRRKYKDRFFSSAQDKKDDVLEEQEEDVIDDGKIRSFDTLFTEREG